MNVESRGLGDSDCVSAAMQAHMTETGRRH